MHTHIEHDVTINDDRFELVVRSRDDRVEIITPIHRTAHGVSIGGMRYVSREQAADAEREVGFLSAAMTRKCSAARLPADGQKTIAVADTIPAGTALRSRFLQPHIATALQEAPGAMFGPDMNVGEDVQDMLSRTSVGHAVTGLSQAAGGLGIDTHGYTAAGLMAALDVSRDRIDAGRGATVQGFGAVGAHAARGLASRGIPVVGVSTRHGALLCDAGVQLDVERLFSLWLAYGEDCLRHYPHHPGVRFVDDPDALLLHPAAVFVPAARTSVIVCAGELAGAENPHAVAVDRWLEVTGVEMVLEGANHPLSRCAEDWLGERGCIVMPDFIVNCGGLIGCYVEWAYRDSLRAGAWADIDARARAYIERVIHANTAALLASEGPARSAAIALAAQNRAEVLASWVAEHGGAPGPAAARRWLERRL